MNVILSEKKLLKLLIITLLFTGCFGLILLEFNVLKYLFTLVLFYLSITSKKIEVPYKKLILCYAFCVLCSCIYSSIYNHQSFIRVVGNSYPYWGLLFVFIVMRYRPTSSQLENVIKYLSVIFCCCYIIQWLIYPIQIFTGSQDESNINDSFFRMRMPGSICAYCLFFYGINQYVLYKRLKDLLYPILGFIPILIMGFRSLTAATAFFAIIMIPFITKSITKTFIWMIVGCIVLIGISQLDIVQTKIDEMLERQESGQTFDNKDYIRFLEYDYFNNFVFTKPGERFFGGGMPSDPSSTYHKNMIDTVERLSYYWVDLGLVGLSFIIGIPAVLLLIYIVYCCIKKSCFIQLQYIRFTLITVLIGSIMTSMELFRPSNMLILSLFLCLTWIYNKENIYKKE